MHRLQTIKGAVINGQETSLAALFKSKKNALDDKQDIVASYVVMSPEDVILGFYSLRCGELYRQVDLQKMLLCANAWEGLNKLRANPNMGREQQLPFLSDIQKALQAGISSPNEWQRFYMKKVSYIRDKKD